MPELPRVLEILETAELRLDHTLVNNFYAGEVRYETNVENDCWWIYMNRANAGKVKRGEPDFDLVQAAYIKATLANLERLGWQPPKAKPFHVSPPGALIAEELEARELSIHAFAQDMTSSVEWVNGLISGENPIDTLDSYRLARIFGTSPQFWQNLETRYREFLTTSAQKQWTVEELQEIYLGWLKNNETQDFLDYLKTL